jgi:hypothetical protein
MSLPVQFLYSAFKLDVRFAIADGTPHQKIGTGFFVGKADGSLYLVTNRHVLDARWDKPGTDMNSKKFSRYSLQSIICWGRPDGNDLLGFELLGPKVSFHTCDTHDVAVTPVVNVISSPDIGHPIQIGNFIKLDDLTTREEFESDIELCDQVGFPGYGEAYSEADQRPIFRVGYVISDPRLPLDYEEVKGEALLIEGFSTSGASGSPVFVFQKGFPLGGGLAVTGGKFHRRWSLLGVNAGHMKSPEHLHSQVSYVFKATVIRDIINGL